MNGIGLITHHELVALKSETTRERWEQEGKLPKPSWVRADRRRLALYPEPILARVVAAAQAAAGLERGLVTLVRGCERLYQSESFLDLRDSAHQVFRDFGNEPWNLAIFLDRLSETASDAVASWAVELSGLEDDLRDTGIRFEAEPGRIVEIAGDHYGVQLDSGGLVEFSSAPNISPVRLTDDAPVVLERVIVGAIERLFLLPATASVRSRKEVPAMQQSSSERLDVIARRERRPSLREQLGLPSLDPREQYNQGFVLAFHEEADEGVPFPKPAKTHSLILAGDAEE